MFFAHSTEDKTCSDWQLLSQHLIDVAELAALFAAVFGAEKTARLAGLLHDLGKYTPAFQARLTGAPEKVDHSTAGAVETFSLVSAVADRAMAELIAYAIAGHHAGVPDRIGDGSLTERLKKQLEPLDPAWRYEIAPGRGSKHVGVEEVRGGRRRPSRRGVDRNCQSGSLSGRCTVAPLAGAWIETPCLPGA